jgi:membrane protease subunit HflC
MSALDRLKPIADSLGDLGSYATPLIAGVITLGIGMFSFTTVDPGQVALRVNNVTGAQEAITQPGLAFTLPTVHSIHILDAAPQEFAMRGDRSVDATNVSQLTVRASDGSNFHFNEFTLVFQLMGDESVQAVADGGVDDGFLKWMKPYARSVLRDEFGRESTIAVSNPSTYAAAGERSRNRFNELLGPHGISVTQIVTPRPQFNQEYEAAIEQRNALSNELEVIGSNLETAETSRQRQLAVVDQQQNKIIQERRAQLEAELAQASARQSDVIREADTYAIEKVAQGQAALSAAQQRAEELRGELDAKYLSRKAEIDAFRTQPVERVMQRLGERLKGVTVNIQPYAEDATPQRVRLENQ